MAEVAFDRVCKQYLSGGPFVVRDLSLRIRDGEFVVLVGPSGCGKTTTLRLVAGLESTTSGEISIGGRIVNNVRPRERDVAMVFQDYALYPHMTAFENMAFALRMRKVARVEVDRRVRDAADLLGVSDLLQRKPAALSGGQRQRIALGRAIVRVPEAQCLLFDEPLSNLDAGLRAAMRSEIKNLHHRLKATMIYVTHDQEEAMALGDRIVVMAGGTLQQDAAPLEVYRRPRNRFVAGFIGLPRMNFVDGVVEAKDASLCFVESGAGGARFNLLPQHAAAARIFGASAVLGVRPEDLIVARETASDGASAFAVTVRLIEALGDRMNVHATTDAGTPLVARVSAEEPIAPQQSLRLRVDPARLHLFAATDIGENLLHRRADNAGS